MDPFTRALVVVASVLSLIFLLCAILQVADGAIAYFSSHVAAHQIFNVIIYGGALVFTYQLWDRVRFRFP